LIRWNGFQSLLVGSSSPDLTLHLERFMVLLLALLDYYTYFFSFSNVSISFLPKLARGRRLGMILEFGLFVECRKQLPVVLLRYMANML